MNSGINQAGVAAAITFADYVPLPAAIRSKTPRGVLVEDILRSAGTLAAALRMAGEFLITTPLVGGNIVIMTPDGGAVLEQLYPQYAVQLISETVTVRTNHFQVLTLPGELAVNRENSQTRFTRFAQLLPVPGASFSVEKIRQALANHEEPHPICRHGGDAVTISTAIYDLGNRTMHYAYGNPCCQTFTQYAV